MLAKFTERRGKEPNRGTAHFIGAVPGHKLLLELLQCASTTPVSMRKLINRGVIATLLLLLFAQSVYIQRVVNQNLQLGHTSDSVLLGTNAFNLGYVSGAKAGMDLERGILLGDVHEERVLGEILNMAYSASARAALNGVFDQAFLLVVESPQVGTEHP